MSKKIVVVDDCEEVAEVLAEILTINGYEVRAFTDGQAVIEAIEGNLPDVIFLDVNMPYVSGFEVLHFLRQQLGGTQTKVILLTGDCSIKNSPEAHLADAFLMKPVDIDDLLRAV